MPRNEARRRSQARPSRRHQARPRLEGLEDRLLLYATTGGLWSDPVRVTFSFVPDGTGVGGTPSTLFQSLNARFPTAAWAIQFIEAAAIWEQVANINLVQVGDDGAPLGAGPDQQGNPSHGDIRIAGVAQPTSQLGVTFLPAPINGGDIAGDIVINSGINWQINGNYDLLTVAIHEFGHALGMGHSQIQQADMYAYYTGVKQSLTPDDTSGIQSIYGPRQVDPWFAYFQNISTSSAVDVTPLIDGNGQVAISRLDINTTSPAEYWKVTVPASNSGSMVVTMQTTNLSELSPALMVLNAQGQIIGSYKVPGTYGATIGLTINNIAPGQVYYVRASAANFGPTSAGGYGLLLNFGGQPQAPIPPAYTTIPDQPSQGGGSLAEVTGKIGLSSRVSLGGLVGLGDALTVAPAWGTGPSPNLAGTQGGAAPIDPSLLVAPAVLDAALDWWGVADGILSTATSKRQAPASLHD